MDGLVGVQRREVGVHFTVILSNVETVGIHILTVDAREQRTVIQGAHSKKTTTATFLGSLEFRFSPLACVLPTDEPDQVVDSGVGDGHHRHGMQLLLSRLHREVNVDLLRSRRANVTLKIRQEAHHDLRAGDRHRQAGG